MRWEDVAPGSPLLQNASRIQKGHPQEFKLFYLNDYLTIKVLSYNN